MHRALKILPANIDPIPDEILKEFNLLKLHDVSEYIDVHCLLLEISLNFLVFNRCFSNLCFMIEHLPREFSILDGPLTLIEPSMK